MNTDFTSINDYTLNYSRDGIHIKIIRTRLNDIIFFKLVKINLLTGDALIEDVKKENVHNVFKLYYPELFNSIIERFKEGIL